MSDIDRLVEFLHRHKKVTVLSGAGCSTASGIPDYRDEDGNWKDAQPVQYNDFVKSEKIRKRYWARSFAGWRRIKHAKPNAAHAALARLERHGHAWRGVNR
jgi:NAD-dependent SIR2 family protein deacetylase